MKNLRQTGRTTRMLEDAKRLAREGRAVYVVAATQLAALRLEVACGAPLELGIKFESEGSLGNFDWTTLELRGVHRNCVVLVDHHAIEARFSRMLEMLHRYDP